MDQYHPQYLPPPNKQSPSWFRDAGQSLENWASKKFWQTPTFILPPMLAIFTLAMNQLPSDPKDVQFTIEFLVNSLGNHTAVLVGSRCLARLVYVVTAIRFPNSAEPMRKFILLAFAFVGASILHDVEPKATSLTLIQVIAVNWLYCLSSDISAEELQTDRDVFDALDFAIGCSAAYFLKTRIGEKFHLLVCVTVVFSLFSFFHFLFLTIVRSASIFGTWRLKDRFDMHTKEFYRRNGGDPESVNLKKSILLVGLESRTFRAAYTGFASQCTQILVRGFNLRKKDSIVKIIRIPNANPKALKGQSAMAIVEFKHVHDACAVMAFNRRPEEDGLRALEINDLPPFLDFDPECGIHTVVTVTPTMIRAAYIVWAGKHVFLRKRAQSLA